MDVLTEASGYESWVAVTYADPRGGTRTVRHAALACARGRAPAAARGLRTAP